MTTVDDKQIISRYLDKYTLQNQVNLEILNNLTEK